MTTAHFEVSQVRISAALRTLAAIEALRNSKGKVSK